MCLLLQTTAEFAFDLGPSNYDIIQSSPTEQSCISELRIVVCMGTDFHLLRTNVTGPLFAINISFTSPLLSPYRILMAITGVDVQLSKSCVLPNAYIYTRFCCGKFGTAGGAISWPHYGVITGVARTFWRGFYVLSTSFVWHISYNWYSPVVCFHPTILPWSSWNAFFANRTALHLHNFT